MPPMNLDYGAKNKCQSMKQRPVCSPEISPVTPT